MFRVLFLVSVLFISLAGCASKPEPRPIAPTLTTPTPTISSAAADAAFQSANFVTAAQAYLDLASAVKPYEKAHYLARAAESFMALKNWQRAKEILRSVEPTNEEQAIEKQILQAEVAIALSEFEQAIEFLSLNLNNLPPLTRIKVLNLRAPIFLHQQQFLPAIQDWVQLATLLDDAKMAQEIHNNVWRALLNFTQNELEEMQAEADSPELLGWINLAYITKSSQGNQTPLEELLFQWQSDFPNHPAATNLAAFTQQNIMELRETPGYPQQIALLLPLSGAYAAAGNAVLSGFLASYFQLPSDQRNLKIKLYDTGSGAENIQSQVQLALQDGAGFMVGPLIKEQVDHLLMLPNNGTTPLLTLNYGPDIPSLSDQITQFGLLPEDEAHQVAERVALQGYLRAASFSAESSHSDRIVYAFAQRFGEVGGEMVQTSSFSSATSNLVPTLQSYLSLVKASTPKKGASSLINTAEANSSNSPPILFLSGNPDEARSLGQQLRFLDGGLSTVFATSEIYSGTLDPRKDHALNGLLFCDMPWVLRSDQEMPLRLTLQSAPGYKPGLVRLQALGLDAFNLIPYLDRLKQNPNESYPGVTGNLNLGENNRIHRKLLWAKFEGGVPRLLENGANP